MASLLVSCLWFLTKENRPFLLSCPHFAPPEIKSGNNLGHDGAEYGFKVLRERERDQPINRDLYRKDLLGSCLSLRVGVVIMTFQHQIRMISIEELPICYIA